MSVSFIDSLNHRLPHSTANHPSWDTGQQPYYCRPAAAEDKNYLYFCGLQRSLLLHLLHQLIISTTLYLSTSFAHYGTGSCSNFPSYYSSSFALRHLFQNLLKAFESVTTEYAWADNLAIGLTAFFGDDYSTAETQQLFLSAAIPGLPETNSMGSRYSLGLQFANDYLLFLSR